MIPIGKYLSVEAVPWAEERQKRTRKTRVWRVLGEGDAFLGSVQWYGPWRQYTFIPYRGADLVFHNGCLRDIAAFLDRANASQRADAAARREERKR